MNLLPKLIPFYLLILLGYISAKHLNLDKETISKILVYILTPAVSFFGIYTMEFSPKYILLSLTIFCTSSIIAITSLKITSQIYKNDPLKNILSFSAGTGNVGYFGLPVILSLLGEQAFSIAIICITGFVLYENTIGFYITAMGHSEPKDALKKVIKHPLIYSITFALILQKLNIRLSSNILELSNIFKATYSVLGMMIIGIVLTKTRFKKLDYKFISLSLINKFILWPAIILLLIKLDKSFLNLYTQETHMLLLILSTAPIAANTATFAILFGIDDQQPASSILISTIMCIGTVPLIIKLL
jgi:hypothetical protein